MSGELVPVGKVGAPAIGRGGGSFSGEVGRIGSSDIGSGGSFGGNVGKEIALRPSRALDVHGKSSGEVRRAATGTVDIPGSGKLAKAVGRGAATLPRWWDDGPMVLPKASGEVIPQFGKGESPRADTGRETRVFQRLGAHTISERGTTAETTEQVTETQGAYPLLGALSWIGGRKRRREEIEAEVEQLYGGDGAVLQGLAGFLDVRSLLGALFSSSKGEEETITGTASLGTVRRVETSQTSSTQGEQVFSGRASSTTHETASSQHTPGTRQPDAVGREAGVTSAPAIEGKPVFAKAPQAISGQRPAMRAIDSAPKTTARVLSPTSLISPESRAIAAPKPTLPMFTGAGLQPVRINAISIGGKKK